MEFSVWTFHQLSGNKCTQTRKAYLSSKEKEVIVFFRMRRAPKDMQRCAQTPEVQGGNTETGGQGKV